MRTGPEVGSRTTSTAAAPPPVTQLTGAAVKGKGQRKTAQPH